MRNNTITAFLVIAVMAATIAQGTPEQDRLWSTRVTCELQTAGAQSLPTLTFSQGSTPLLSLDQYRAGKSVNADSNIVARLVFGPTQTNQYYVAVTNYAVSGNGYLIQCPTIGTNTTAGAWWYTAYFESTTGHRYWTGNGRLSIVATTSTADGLSWQEFVSGDSITPDELAAALLAYEPVLPSTPTNPASKFLNGNREWSSISDGVLRVHDSAQPSRYFLEVVNSTGTVYEVTGPFSGLSVALSTDFEATVNHARPEWSVHDFPFADGDWIGFVGNDYYTILYSPADAEYRSGGLELPAILNPVQTETFAGTAVVSNREYYVTNEIARMVSEVELAEVKAEISAGITNLVESATNALALTSQSTRYGSLVVTNQPGFASFAEANPAQTYMLLGPGTGASTNTAYFQWPVSGGRVLSASTVTYLSPGSLGVGASAILSVYDGNGILLASNAVSTTLTAWGELPFLTNVLANAAAPSNGTIRLSVTVAKTTGQSGARLYVGGVTPLSLGLSQTTSFFSTAQENEAMRSRTSHVLAQWYDDSGVVTQQVLRIGDQLVTNRWGIGVDGATNITDGVTSGTYSEATRTLNISNLLAGVSVELPDGILTNNYTGMVRLRDGLTVSGNSVFSNDLRVVGGTYLGQTFFSADGAIYCYGATSMYAPYGFAWQYWTGSSVANAFYYDWNGVTANAYVPGGSLTVRDTVAASSFTATGTNTAAVVRSTGGYIIGPTISGKQAHIFTDGTNCFFVNVNNVTNALTTN